MNSVKDYLEMMCKFRKDFAEGKLKYSCFEDFILQNGEAFTKIKKVTKMGKQKECFMNAFHLADDNQHLIYVEGYGVTKVIGFPFLHAWCVDQDGNVLDPTWRDGVEYFGVKFSLQYVRKTILERRAYGVLDNMEQRFPLITGKDTDFKYKKEVVA